MNKQKFHVRGPAHAMPSPPFEQNPAPASTTNLVSATSHLAARYADDGDAPDTRPYDNGPQSAPERNPLTLYVRGGDKPTKPHGLAQSILHVLKDNPDANYVDVRSVGDKAERTVMAAYRIARKEIAHRTPAATIAIVQWEVPAEMGGQRTIAINTRVFGKAVRVGD